MKFLRFAWCLALLFAGPAGFSQKSDIVTFDAPNATATYPTGINARGEIVGGMRDSKGISHGFLRSPKGEFTIFDASVGGSTGAVAINNSGVIIGNVYDSNGYHGFIRMTDGQIMLVDYPEARYTTLTAINNLGVAVGYFLDNTDYSQQHGLIRNPDGSLIEFIDHPGGFIRPLAINDSGEIAGTTFMMLGYSEGTSRAFLRTPDDGKVIDFNVGGATGATSINDSGEIGGYWQTNVVILDDPQMAFERAPDGTITTFEAPVQNPASTSIGVATLNERGTAAGGYGYLAFYVPNQAETSFVHYADGSFQTADFPANVSSVATGINARGEVAGYYWDVSSIGSSQVAHGYIWTPKKNGE